MADIGETHEDRESDRIRSADKPYAEICANICATDDYSFKLLGLVPLVSGGGIVALLTEANATTWASFPIAIFSLLGATVTLGLFCWELRNIQTCRWLQDCAGVIAQRFGFPARPAPSKFVGIEIRKETGEKMVYAATVAAWLAMAIAACVRSQR
ncbi:MAG TPA: hypothetical protein VN812_23100 [Candidatus Acidoferrales bacterium]|nr:hypothetical protein [Candidatus Acidoferrales bacterium]